MAHLPGLDDELYDCSLHEYHARRRCRRRESRHLGQISPMARVVPALLALIIAELQLVVKYLSYLRQGPEVMATGNACCTPPEEQVED
jgi:hypothetical protein